MTSFTEYTKKAALMLAGCVAWLGGQLSALEVSDLTYPITRAQADTTLDKDYTYSMMADGSIRRTWSSDTKTIFIDFDTNTNEAVLIAIIYKKPVDKKEGIADAHTLAKGLYSENAKWDAPKDKTSRELISDVFGLRNAKRKKLTDKAMLFFETNDKGTKVERVSLFANLPKTNRWKLDVVTPGSKQTAMGTSWSNDFVESMYKDEAQRQQIPLATAATPAADTPEQTPANTAEDTTTAADTTSSTTPTPTGTTATTTVPTPTTPTAEQPRRTGRRTAMGTRLGGTDSSSSSTPVNTSPGVSSRPSTATQPQEIRKVIREHQEAKTIAVSTLPPAPDFLKDFGVENPEWWHYIVLGIIALILLFIIFRAISKARQRAVQQKKFTQVLGGRQLRR